MAGADVEDTARRLRLVVGQLVRLTKAETAGAAGLPAPQVAALGSLDRDGAMTTAELASVLMVRHQSASRVVGLLAGARLVVLKPHPTDGRKQLVAITASGRRALSRQRDQRAEWLANVINNRLSLPEQRTLAKATELLARLVEP